MNEVNCTVCLEAEKVEVQCAALIAPYRMDVDYANVRIRLEIQVCRLTFGYCFWKIKPADKRAFSRGKSNFNPVIFLLDNFYLVIMNKIGFGL